MQAPKACAEPGLLGVKREAPCRRMKILRLGGFTFLSNQVVEEIRTKAWKKKLK